MPEQRSQRYHRERLSEALREEIEDVVGDCRLGSPELITGLCVVSKRMDTGSPWILANNPKAPFWKTKLLDTVTGEKGFAGDGHPATSAEFDGPGALCIDKVGNLYVADTANQRIRMIGAAHRGA